jgi:hypothetical protein
MVMPAKKDFAFPADAVCLGAAAEAILSFV